MILVTDIHYFDSHATAAGLVFEAWYVDVAHQQHVVRVKDVAPYESGQFYKRELPCILKLLKDINKSYDVKELEAIVIDGYVTLGKEQRDGLGMYLYRELGGEVAIIGVAKNEFEGTPEVCKLLRGQSKKPIFVTSIGIELEDAKRYIQDMHGSYRLPTLLKEVDQLCRGV